MTNTKRILSVMIKLVLTQLILTIILLPISSPLVAAILGSAIGSVLVIYSYSKGNDYKIASKLDTNLTSILLGILIGMLSFVISIFIAMLIKNTEQGATTSLLTQQSGLVMVFTTIFGVFIAPIFEELVFRGIFRDIIKDNITYIITSGLIFGVLHMQADGSFLLNLQLLLSTGALGLLYAYAYVKSDNLLVPILAHITYNFTVFIITLA